MNSPDRFLRKWLLRSMFSRSFLSGLRFRSFPLSADSFRHILGIDQNSQQYWGLFNILVIRRGYRWVTIYLPRCIQQSIYIRIRSRSLLSTATILIYIINIYIAGYQNIANFVQIFDVTTKARLTMAVWVKLSGISPASWRVKGIIPTKVDLLWLPSGLEISGSVKKTYAPSLHGRWTKTTRWKELKMT